MNSIEKIQKVQADIEAGFLSESARKRALGDLSNAYHKARNEAGNVILAERAAGGDHKRLTDLFYSIPMDLHQVRDRHFEALSGYSAFAQARDLLALRELAKAAALVAKPRDEQVEKVEAVRRTIVEEMERRKTRFIEGLDMARHFRDLAVSVNAHWVHGHKGAVFLRRFFFLNGRLTPLQTIIAIAERLDAERA